MSRAVVSVATGHFRRGQDRLKAALDRAGECGHYWSHLPSDWPTHEKIPYAFKACALKATADRGFDTLLWCDACILPVKPLDSLWERIEREGYWVSNNGWANAEWTADSAYPDLFPEFRTDPSDNDSRAGDRALQSSYFNGERAREVNKDIPHVVATAFGISLKSDVGSQFLDKYYRLATQTKAFCGPWINSNHPDWLTQPGARVLPRAGDGRVAPCGPPDVRGHRHDQSCASVLAWRLGMKLTDPPEIFAYGKSGEVHDSRTILLADGGY